ncbi:MAG: hypothetical protein HYX66_07145 [Ignavibacteria bacterium]|nr:hypothetical protein [Ignavibacteria bacterium]
MIYRLVVSLTAGGLILIAGSVVYAGNPMPHRAVLSDAIRLTYRLPQQEAFRYEAVDVVQQIMKMANREITTDTKTKLDLIVKVQESVLNSSKIDIDYNKASILVTINGMDSKTAHPTETELLNVSGKSSTITISPNGTIVSGTYDASDSSFPEVTSLLKTTGILRKLFPLFPTSDVVPGSTWTQNLQDTTPATNGLGFIVTTGTVTLSFRGTFDTLGTRCWIIDASADNLVQQGSYETGTISVTLTGTGDLNGISLHNAHTGILLISESSMSTRTTMNFASPVNTTIPLESTENLSIRQLHEGIR